MTTSRWTTSLPIGDSPRATTLPSPIYPRQRLSIIEASSLSEHLLDGPLD